MEKCTKIDGYSLMSKMRKLRRKFPLTSSEQALFYELVAICNDDGWDDVFSCSCFELCNSLQISKNTLVKARVSLINAGLISYKSGKSRRQFSKYSFLEVSIFDTDVGRGSSTDNGTIESETLSTNNKLNYKELFIEVDGEQKLLFHVEGYLKGDIGI